MAFQKSEKKSHDDFNSRFDLCVGAFARFINDSLALFSASWPIGYVAGLQTLQSRDRAWSVAPF